MSGKPLGDNIARAEVHNDDVIRTVENPIYREGALAVLKGNLAPDGCVIKPSACEPRFLNRPGAGVLSMKKAIDDPDLDVSPPITFYPAQCRAAGRAPYAGMGHAADPDQSW